MKTLNKLLCLLILLSLGYFLKAQNDNENNTKKYELKLKTNSFVPEALNSTMQKRGFDLEKNCFNAYYYAILQFNEIPNLNTVQKLKNLDVHIGNYLPFYTLKRKRINWYTC